MSLAEAWWIPAVLVALSLPFILLLASLALHRASAALGEPAWHVVMAVGMFLLLAAPDEVMVAGWRVPLALTVAVPPLVALTALAQRLGGTQGANRACLTLAFAALGITLVQGLLSLVELAPTLPPVGLAVRLVALGAGILTVRAAWLAADEPGSRGWEVGWGAGVVGLATFLGAWAALMFYVVLDQRPSVLLLGLPPLVGAACGAVMGAYVHALEEGESQKRRRSGPASADERYDRFFQDYPTALLLVDPDTGAVTDANLRAQELTGSGIRDLEGQALESLFMEPVPETAEKGRFTLRRTGADPLPVGGRTSRLKVGDRDYQVVAFQDIRQELEDIDRQIRLERLEVVSRVAGGLSHDFSNLLQGILGYADHLQPDSPAHALRIGLAAIHRYAVRGSELAGRLRALSQEPDLVRGTSSARAVVADAKELIERGVAMGMTVQVRLCDEPARIPIPAGRLRDVLLNLAVHARDNMPHGGLLRIEVGLQQVGEEDIQQGIGLDAGTYVQVAVTDTGEGLDPALLGGAFEPYRSLERGPSELGLAVVWATVRTTGGWAEVDSEPGVGTTVRMLFPVADVEDPETAPTAFQLLQFDPVAQHMPSEITWPPPFAAEQEEMAELLGLDRTGGEASPRRSSEGVERVLVVDDEEDLRDMVVILLGARGIEVIGAAGGRQALEILGRDRDFDAIILDMVMPGMDGGEVLEELHRQAIDIPVVLATGYSPEELEPRARAKVACTLRKPFQTDELVRALEDCQATGAR